MSRTLPATGIAALALVVAVLLNLNQSTGAAGNLPDPRVDERSSGGMQTAVLAGGCFWGMEAVFEHVKGVSEVVSGYTGGHAVDPTYEEVSSGRTGHAESVRITYDPARVSYGQLLKVDFEVAHDPTELNRQGPDTGTQYRSAVFYTTPEQKRIAEAYIAQLQAAHAFGEPIVTQVVPLERFYPAEGYHQNYLDRHPNQPYIVFNDLPKIARLKERLPGLYADK
jgi:peptide-methionine (S)-S-oxide reductase